ncbi:MAG: helix-turn-helix domain-containing protein [Xenococcus sp. (in: cyanobacteria)]
MHVGTKEVASILGVSVERVRLLLKQGRIKGAFKVGRIWVIPLEGGRPIISKGRRGPKARWNRNHKVGVTKIYVKKNEINSNYYRGERKPVISVNRSNHNAVCGHEVLVSGPCRIVYDPDKHKNPRLWIETISQVDVIVKDIQNNMSIIKSIA